MTEHPLSDPEIEITPEEAERRVQDGAQLIDVREPYEWEAGRIPGARHLELERLSSQAATIDKDAPVVFHCRAGVRSLMAAQAFRRAGYDAYSMSGGIEQWQAEGRAFEPADGHVAPH
ncbi:MAG: rhodanese-like domain-containing protein [Solirubrobacterales bacterium]|nr:rhodanese-like domain-containing protein [Solirubrobacterales bacterium]